MSLDKKYIEHFVNVSSKAALASSYLVGKKDKIAADQAAVDAMRIELNKIDMNGTIVIGEGALDEAPLLYTGEKLGNKRDLSLILLSIHLKEQILQQIIYLVRYL